MKRTYISSSRNCYTIEVDLPTLQCCCSSLVLPCHDVLISSLGARERERRGGGGGGGGGGGCSK